VLALLAEHVLSNKAYIGILEQKKASKQNYKDKRVVKLDEKDHIIAYDTHEPIIEKSVYYGVQKVLRNKNLQRPKQPHQTYLFAGFLRCFDCGYALIRNCTSPKGKKYVYYKCRTYNQKGNKACNAPHSVRYERLYDITLKKINHRLNKLIDIENTIAKYKADLADNDSTDRILSAISKKKSTIKKIEKVQIKLYSDYATGTISQEDYLKYKDGYADEISALQCDCNNLKQELDSEDNLVTGKINWIEDLIAFGEIRTLERDLLIKVVDIIYVDYENRIYVQFKNENKSDVHKRDINAIHAVWI